jgi:UDP-N-acetyl-D-glucosamine dehydrogenase
MRMLMDKGAVLSYNDPHVPNLKIGGSVMHSVEASPANIAAQDCVILLTDHSAYDIAQIVAAAKLVIDTRNSTKDLKVFKDKVMKLGAGNNVPGAAHYEDGHDEASVLPMTH